MGRHHLAGSGLDALGTRARLDVAGQSLSYHRIAGLAPADLPVSLRILLENVARFHDGTSRGDDQVRAILARGASRTPVDLYASRVFLHDTNGVPTVVDLAAMRDAMTALGGDPSLVDPVIASELVVDHSVIADVFGRSDALTRNVELEYARNGERYRFLKWGQRSLKKFAVVPPGTGIMHQVNVEHLARVVMVEDGLAFPDVCLGTDSHTTMVNGLGVLGWGIGGIEAEAAMLGQSMSALVPDVVGVRLTGELPAGATATDLVLTLTERLRAHGVIGKFVEFHGTGVTALPVADRVTIANMSPEFGSTCALFPVDDETLRYLRFTGRSEAHVALVEAYAKEQGLWHRPGSPPRFTDTVDLDLTTVVPSLAGPSRPEDRVPLDQAKSRFRRAVASLRKQNTDGDTATTAPTATTATTATVTTATPGTTVTTATVVIDGTAYELRDGAVAIAAITSCTNTSNPAVMVGAGLLARNAVRAGLRSRPWVKTTLSPGSRVVMDYYRRAGLLPALETLGFHLAGFGCMTCIGASGPLISPVSGAIADTGLTVVSVLSGNRNFEGRIQPEVAMNYLASPPLVIAYALTGTMDIDLATEPLGHDAQGDPVFLRDIWPDPAEIEAVMAGSIDAAMFTDAYGHVFDGDRRWQDISVPATDRFAWDENSTYIRRPPYLDGMTREPEAVKDITGARVLVKLGDQVTTDHISPAGAITASSAAARHLAGLGVSGGEFNTYASRRGNHEVMMRGAFANVRLRNQVAPGTRGGRTLNFLQGGREGTVHDTAAAYREAGVPMVVVAGRDYGGGSSRDWAAKGPALLGVRAVIAQSFERIHRSNLVAMGVLPLELLDGGPQDLAPTGAETITVHGLETLDAGQIPSTVRVHSDGRQFTARVRLDTPREADYFRHGGVMPYVLRGLLADTAETDQ
ncbi:aconitate hydratase AcnA [Streptomyces caniscabiei]|uniref:aconitate hydratase AcnA n=1 Tax=Streptomyces caniscabiei TaxID=2746961 RepID=UPI0029B98522|nr:aconitate hydratase AcnA [Streptomyces caniscabiei]MDX2602581.1 aconitate hydratase AcnA [Streptomyces caniscabiei]MDX2734437.1 aconitate hydratase AcnA [Streptomyces caniscabiei]MDX2776914.1 aconitate hydratase AcnA [Streptomyces caniscabiei]